MFHIILYQPEIPPNTGNIIRLASNTGSSLSLIRPLGFSLEDKKLKRAGLDYSEWSKIFVYDSIDDCLSAHNLGRVYAFSTKGSMRMEDVEFSPYDAFLFGPETRGLPSNLRSRFSQSCVRIPMHPASRSLNLSNAVSVVVFEAWRQQGYTGSR